MTTQINRTDKEFRMSLIHALWDSYTSVEAAYEPQVVDDKLIPIIENYIAKQKQDAAVEALREAHHKFGQERVSNVYVALLDLADYIEKTGDLSYATQRK